MAVVDMDFQQWAGSPAVLSGLYGAMFAAREIDRLEAQYVKRGDAAFSVAGAGHEASAALATHLLPQDYLHLHYRDKALMLARGLPPKAFFLALFGKDASPSRGRQMSAHLADRGLHLLSLTGPVGNHALQAVGIAAEIHAQACRPIVVCAMGDGSSQQGEVLEAIAEAVRRQLPVLFLIEDNGLAISTRTRGQTFFDLPQGPADSFLGLCIHRLDGTDALGCLQGLGAVVASMREGRGPAIVHMAMQRLADHTNADDQALYRAAEDIAQARLAADPLSKLRGHLLVLGLDVHGIEAAARDSVHQAARQALADAEPCAQSRVQAPLPALAQEYRGHEGGPRLTMLAALRGVLRQRLAHDPRVSLYGQDIEDPKGDVFGLTRGLSTEFPGRVLNAPLSESTIVGTAIGRSLAGGRPVAFLQFADFLPLAFNQIASELGSMYWRTDGQWQCPVIVMVACGAYRPGLGPFHAQSLESLAAHVPGLDVYMPATAADAAGLLQAAFDAGRPAVFFYPKNCLNETDARATTSADLERQRVTPGLARRVRQGSDLTLVAWGNAVALGEQAADALQHAGIGTELLDLRTISPWDEAGVIASAQRTGRLLVVHEDNRSCGFGAEILATVMEKAQRVVKAARAVRGDTYVPYHFDSQLEVLPSLRTVLAQAATLLGLDIGWERVPQPEPGVYLLQAGGTAPSDRSVLLLQWQVGAGHTVQEGQLLACLEGSKSVFELESPVSGTVEALLAQAGQDVAVGTPLARIRLAEHSRRPPPGPRWLPVMPAAPAVPPAAATPCAAAPAVPVSGAQAAGPVGILAVASALGSRELANAELLREHWQQSDADIARKTGIRSRRRAAEHEDVVSLATLAARRVLDQTGLQPADIGLVICATGTNDLLSPSVACRVMDRLGGTGLGAAAYDLNAACAGYLYALKAAHDHLRCHPQDHVLLVTSEIISPLLDHDDITTAILFGDAATATIVSGSAHRARQRLVVEPPLLGCSAEPGRFLRVPHQGSGTLSMDGMKVFEMGVRCMTAALKQACARSDLAVDALDLLVPHQANQRILETICSLLRLPREKLYANLARTGNTSSSSIPICLAELLEEKMQDKTLGLAAFGAGFTYGACVLRSSD